MAERSLFDAVLDHGIRNPNFFEGRLLTADALRDDQQAHRDRQRMLGRAIGAGIVDGLTVRLEPDLTDQGVRQTITIERGFAINRDGDTLALNTSVTADVIPPIAKPESPTSLFTRCPDTDSLDSTVPTGTGIYILIMSPASGFRDRAPKSGLGVEGKIIGCGDRYMVEGVSFRLEPLQPDMISGADQATRDTLKDLMKPNPSTAELSVLRNLIAHLCFGTLELAEFSGDPFATDNGSSALATYGALDDLRELVDPNDRPRLSDCDVPLALLLWNQSGIAFLDMWAVRRRHVTEPNPEWWPHVSGTRTAAEAEARLLQFHHHINDLLDLVTVPPNISALNYFKYLPPAGILPIARQTLRGLSASIFFKNLTVRFPRPPNFDSQDGPIFMEGARLGALMRMSYDYDAHELASNEAIWIYRLSQNRREIDTSVSGAPAEVVVFSTGRMPYFASPQFDLTRWDYSNYSSERLGPDGI